MRAISGHSPGQSHFGRTAKNRPAYSPKSNMKWGDEMTIYSDLTVTKDADGFYRPSTEAEVISLIQYAVSEQRQIRVRGASHSMAWSIYTDPVDGNPANKVSVRKAPDSDDLNLSLVKFGDLEWIDEEKGIVEAGAGMHLGNDPYDAEGVSTLENSLLYQIAQKGWAVNDLGGITHQTVSGFALTGSAGGSTQYSFDNIIAWYIIDGTGTARWVEVGDPHFPAVSVSMGLYGIVTKVRLQLVPMYNVAGTEVTTQMVLDAQPSDEACPIDMFGPGKDGKPSLEQYLRETPYTRFVWWPQKGAERAVIWKADRAPVSTPGGKPPVPYMQFPESLFGLLEELLASVFFTLLGNHGVTRILQVLAPSFFHAQHLLTELWSQKVGRLLAGLGSTIIILLVAAILFIPVLIFALFPGILHALFPVLMPVFESMTKDNPPTTFNDYYWRSLPMDNTADDVLLGTEFTEIWVPISYAQQCMNLMQDMFTNGGSAATGYYSTEVYGGAPSSNWMSAAYTDGNDEFKDGVIRFDVYWFRNNEKTPNEKQGFFQQYWDLFLSNNIPFRLHWGKFIPAYDFPFWAEHYRKMLPHFDDFLALRTQYDPNNIFFTEYWQCRLLGGPLTK